MLQSELTEKVTRIYVEREGFCGWIELEEPASVKKAESNSLLIRLINKPMVSNETSAVFRIKPY
tara:strand:+ start:87 stop:278 length:192 start_codon:yes stop_codon:yes gene_type:complete